MNRRALAPLALIVLTSCWFSHKATVPKDAFTVTAVDGDATVQSGSETARTIVDNMKIPLKATIALARGTVTLGRGDSLLELRPVADGRLASMTLQELDQAEVGSGLLLATIDSAAKITVSSQGVSAAASKTAVFRFDRQLSARVGVYEGSVDVTTTETTLTVPAFHEAVIAGRLVPREPVPFVIDRSDVWDRSKFADVIALDDALRTQALGYERQFGAHFSSVSELAPLQRDAGRDVGFVARYLPALSRGDVIISLEIALLAERAGKGSAQALLGDLVARFDQNATWGLVARMQGVAPNDLRRAVERAIGVLIGEVRATPPPSTSPTKSPPKTPPPTCSPASCPPPPPPPTRGPLAAPTDLQAFPGTCQILQSTSVDLTWTKSASTDADGYEIFRNGVSIGKVSGRDTDGFTDTGVEFSKTYSYKVKTTRGTSRSAFSAAVSITTQNNLCQAA